MKIQPTSISSETLAYIGHGQLESSPASTSVLHVIGHELDHVTEFRNDAIRDRAEIHSIDMKIDYEFRNGKLVAVSGETSATIRKKQDDKDSENKISNPPTSQNQSIDKKNETIKISNEEKNLLLRLSFLESEISKLENKNYYTSTDAKDLISQKEEAKKLELKEKKREIEIEIANFKIDEQIKKSKNFIQESIEKFTDSPEPSEDQENLQSLFNA